MPSGQELPPRRAYDAVLFDLLTALIDSSTLWNAVAQNAEDGAAWRARYLALTYGIGSYVPYEELVDRAAADVGLPQSCPQRLIARWSELEPWPEAAHVLQQLGVPLGVVTNCSEALASRAAQRVGVPFRVLVSAERAGAYKPSPAPYELALHELGIAAERVLFVAGSAYDIPGARRVGMSVYWHNRIGLPMTPDALQPLREERSLTPLIALTARPARNMPLYLRSRRRDNSR